MKAFSLHSHNISEWVKLVWNLFQLQIFFTCLILTVMFLYHKPLTLPLETHSPAKFISNLLQHTWPGVFILSDPEYLESLRVVAKLYRTVGLPQQGWRPMIYILVGSAMTFLFTSHTNWVDMNNIHNNKLFNYRCSSNYSKECTVEKVMQFSNRFPKHSSSSKQVVAPQCVRQVKTEGSLIGHVHHRDIYLTSAFTSARHIFRVFAHLQVCL